MAALEQMIVLFLMMLIGYIAFKKQMITPETNRHISGIVVNIANPALILSSVVGDTAQISAEGLLLTFPVAVGIFAFLILISMILPKLLCFPAEERGMYAVMIVFNNIGFMGFPIMRAMFGSEALLYAGIFLFLYNVLIYTYGIRIIGGGKEKQKNPLRRIMNMGVIACILALVIFMMKIKLPAFMVTSIDMLSNLTAPLSMMCIGASMADMDLKKLFLDGRMLLFAGVKLLVIPVLVMKLLGIFVHQRMLLGVVMVIVATPVGSMTSMLAQEYGGDYGKASKGVAVTSCLSVLTIPIVAFLTLQ